MMTFRTWALTLGAVALVLLLLVGAGCKSNSNKNSYSTGNNSSSSSDWSSNQSKDISGLPPTKDEPVATADAPTQPQPVKPPSKSKIKVSAPTSAEIAAAKKAGTRRATIKTVQGTMIVELYGKDAPQTVANFIKLAKAKFYNGLNFHRVETSQEFRLIQGGCPNGNGTGDPGYSIKLETSPKLQHVAGALAMARSSEPDSAGCQFYICINPVHQLDGEYAVFGKVIKGLDVADKIAVGDKIISITVK